MQATQMVRKSATTRTLALASLGLLLGLSPVSHAALVLELSADGDTVVIQDQMAGDINPFTGSVTYIGGVGGFDINITTGSSKPVLGSVTNPVLDLTSLEINGGQTGTITVRLTDTDFISPDWPNTQAITAIGGTTGGSVSLQSYLDNGNAEFGTGTLIADIGPLDTLAFSAQGGSLVDPAAPFSLTMVATITHDGTKQVTSFDAYTKVPEPSTLTLMGLTLFGLGGLGAVRRIRRRRNDC